MRDIYLCWSNNAILGEATSLKFGTREQMLRFIRENKNVFEKAAIFDECADDKGDTFWLETEYNLI